MKFTSEPDLPDLADGDDGAPLGSEVREVDVGLLSHALCIL